ncbi:MAG TPA: DUF1735 domain-containing protein [Flavisolibacter sp.]|jgi:hypothetical protein
MKKIILNTLFLATLGFTFTGCLKDKGFEKNEYGINDPDDSPEGIGFPWAYNPDPRIISVNPSTSLQTVNAPTVLFLAGDPAPKDIHVNLVANQSLVTDWNANPDNTPFATFPAGAYNIPGLKVTIPAGSRLGVLNINVPTTNGLSFSDIYGLGFTIASVDEPGYIIAENLKNIIVGINVANQYAGSYRVTGFFFHPTAQRAIDDVKDLGTVSATGCRAPHSDLYTQNYFFDFDVSPTNTLINYTPRGATPPVPASGFMTADVSTPGGISPYPAAGSDKPGQGEWIHSKYNNTYDPVAETFWMHYGYGAGSNSQTGWTRQVYEKWVKE